MTWKELKIITLQKLFAITGDEIVEDDATGPYLKSMPGAANEALMLLSTAGRFIERSLVIRQVREGDGAGPAPGEVISIVKEGGVNRYDLDTLAADFYSFSDSGVFVEGQDEYRRTGDYVIEGESIIVLSAAKEGRWTVYYNAYPKEITSETEDGAELAVAPEVAVLMPLYMASQLYKDDDIGAAVSYRNEFEAGREALVISTLRRKSGKERFYAGSGWW